MNPTSDPGPDFALGETVLWIDALHRVRRGTVVEKPRAGVCAPGRVRVRDRDGNLAQPPVERVGHLPLK
jgi:hypothetical protein